MDVGVTNLRLLVPCIRTGVAAQAQNRTATVGPLCSIEPAADVGTVVTDLTDTVTELEQVDIFPERFEELLLADRVAHSTGVEPVEAIVGTELLGTVVSTIVLSEVAAVVVISGTEGPVLTVM